MFAGDTMFPTCISGALRKSQNLERMPLGLIRLIAGFVQRCDTEKPIGLLSILNVDLFGQSLNHSLGTVHV